MFRILALLLLSAPASAGMTYGGFVYRSSDTMTGQLTVSSNVIVNSPKFSVGGTTLSITNGLIGIWGKNDSQAGDVLQMLPNTSSFTAFQFDYGNAGYGNFDFFNRHLNAYEWSFGSTEKNYDAGSGAIGVGDFYVTNQNLGINQMQMALNTGFTGFGLSSVYTQPAYTVDINGVMRSTETISTGKSDAQSYTVKNLVAFSSVPIQHACGSDLTASLTSGTSFFSFIPDSAITLRRVTTTIAVAGVGGTGDNWICGSTDANSITDTTSAAAAAGTTHSTVGLKNVAKGTQVYCWDSSTASPNPIANVCLEYTMQ